MGKALDDRQVESIKIVNVNTDFKPISYSSPMKWKVVVGFVFTLHNSAGEEIGQQSSSNSSRAKVPYFLLVDNLDHCPSDDEIVNFLYAEGTKERMQLFVVQQWYNLAGVILPGFDIDENGNVYNI
jgi:hypothetical protein